MALIRLPWQDGKAPEPVPRHIPGTPIQQLTVLAPIAPGRRGDLAGACAALEAASGGDAASPFSALAQVHMLRFDVLDTLPVGARRPKSVALDVPTLIFGASFEGNTGHLARSMIDVVPTWCDAVFGCCIEYPGLDRLALAAWFRRFEVEPNLPFAAGVWSRSQIEQAIARTERLRQFMPDAELRAAFVSEFGADVDRGAT